MFMCDGEDFEPEGGQLFDGVYDIWKVIERRNVGAIVDADNSCINLWKAWRASGPEHSLRSRYDSR